MLDRVDPGEYRVARCLVAVAVAGDLLAQPVGLVAQRGHLGQRELRSIDLVGQREHAAGGAELDHVGPVLDLVADRLAQAVRPARDALGFVPLRKQVVPQPGPVGMAADSPERVHAHEHPRPGNDSLGDRISQADVEKIVGADVANRRETRLDRPPGVDGRKDCLLRNLPAHAVDKPLVIVGCPLMGQVRMSVDEARAEGGVAQVDHRRASGIDSPAPTALMVLPSTITIPFASRAWDLPSNNRAALTTIGLGGAGRFAAAWLENQERCKQTARDRHECRSAGGSFGFCPDNPTRRQAQVQKPDDPGAFLIPEAPPSSVFEDQRG